MVKMGGWIKMASVMGLAGFNTKKKYYHISGLGHLTTASKLCHYIMVKHNCADIDF